MKKAAWGVCGIFWGFLGQLVALEWKATDNVLPEDSGVGFVQHDGSGTAFSMADGELKIETTGNQSAWLELPLRVEEGVPFSVEVELSGEADPGASSLHLQEGDKGLFTWLWEKEYYRISTDGKSNHEYKSVDVGSSHIYRIEIDGVDILIRVDGETVYAGKLDEPLREPQLLIGDMTEGGGITRVRRISVEGTSGGTRQKTLSSAGLEASPQLVWSGKKIPASGMRWNFPAQADALIMTVEYRAAFQRQGQIYVVCEGGFGRRILSVGTGHASIANDDYRAERFFLSVPRQTQSVHVFLEVATSEVPFAVKEWKIQPVRIVASNTVFERAGGIGNDKVGQSFAVEGDVSVAGVAVPLVRLFGRKELRSKLECRMGGSDEMSAVWDVPDHHVPREVDGMAVFMGNEPVSISRLGRFILNPGITASRFFGWYDSIYSWADPLPGGNYFHKDREEIDWDMTFYVFAEVAE